MKRFFDHEASVGGTALGSSDARFALRAARTPQEIWTEIGTLAADDPRIALDLQELRDDSAERERIERDRHRRRKHAWRMEAR